jgi:RNA polymerase sigma-70 factor (ECF subfamily)
VARTTATNHEALRLTRREGQRYVNDRARAGQGSEQRLPDADAWLLEQIRSGNAEAGHQFVREHYRAIYRYLLYLTEQPDLAEDLTQETFLQAWRHLDTFQGRGSLRGWLHRIARREFLDLLQRRPDEVGLDGMAEVATPDATAWMESVELHLCIHRLPLEEREVLLLHHLEGYTSAEIAVIVGFPARTVRLRLAQAREHLRQELGEDDLTYVNEPLAPMRQWAWLPLDQMHALETRLALGGKAKEDAMERREFLRQAAVGAAGLALSEPGKEIVDGRLTQKVTLAFKGTALSDLCDHLRSETGIYLTAGASVADEKVTLFCKAMPLRDVMRQLSRPFGYTWTRSKREGGEYRYELVQDLRSQLLEEELRNRDRNAALLALEREIERYRRYLDLSPDEALARAKTATPEEKKLLEALAGPGWGALQIYSQLSSSDLVALRSGQTLTFSAEPLPNTDERLLPPNLARGVLQSVREGGLLKNDKYGYSHTSDLTDPRALSPTAVPEARAYLRVEMRQSEPGQFILMGYSGVFIAPATGMKVFMLLSKPLAVGISPAVLRPQNGQANVRLARDPALRPRVAIQPQPSCGANLSPSPSPTQGEEQLARSASERGLGQGVTAANPDPKVTTADVLEALHRATGSAVVADYYTRLYHPRDVSVQNQPLFDALNQLADAMRLRWNRDGEWLQFRSAGYYHDRLKEVPNRLLSRWAASRRKHGALMLDDLVEIAQLSDAQLDADEMAEGARLCFGLSEWDLARWRRFQRPHLRFLAELTAAQRLETMSATGLLFTRMSLAQQQRFISLAFEGRPLQSLEDLAGATLRVDYSLPGWYQWGSPDEENYTRWVVPLEPGPRGRRVPRPPVRERTRDAAILAVRRVDPQLRNALLQAMCRADPRVAAAPPSEEAQVFPSRLDLKIIYVPGATNAREIVVIWSQANARHGGG